GLFPPQRCADVGCGVPTTPPARATIENPCSCSSVRLKDGGSGYCASRHKNEISVSFCAACVPEIVVTLHNAGVVDATRGDRFSKRSKATRRQRVTAAKVRTPTGLAIGGTRSRPSTCGEGTTPRGRLGRWGGRHRCGGRHRSH